MEYVVLTNPEGQVVGVSESLPEELASKYDWQVTWDGASGGSFAKAEVIIANFVLAREV